MATLKFYHPETGVVETIETGKAFLATLFFGPLFFIYKKVWLHVFIFIILLSVGDDFAVFVWIFYPFFTKGILVKHYLKKAFVEISE